MIFTDEGAAYERSCGSDPALWDAAGEYERLREEGMTPHESNLFLSNGKEKI